VAEPSFFNSNEEFRRFLNTKKGFYDIDVPDIQSPQFTQNPFNYFDDDTGEVNPELNKVLRREGGSSKEIDFLHAYIGMEDNIRKSKKQLSDANESVSSLINKAIESKNPDIWFKPDETLYRGSRVSAENLTPNIGDIVEFNRFRSTSPNPELARRFSSLGENAYLSSEDAKERFGEGNRGRFEVIEPLHGGLRLGNPLEGEDQEVLLKPAKFEVIDKKLLKPMRGDALEFLKYKQIFSLDPVGAAIKGGEDLLRRNPTGSALGASISLLNPEVAQAVEKNRYGEAAGVVAQDVVGGALTEAGIKAAAPTAARYAPGLVRAAAPLSRFAGPVATGAALFGQGRPGSLTDVITRKAAENPIPFTPRVKPDPKTDLGRMAGNELRYMFGQLTRGRLPYFNQ